MIAKTVSSSHLRNDSLSLEAYQTPAGTLVGVIGGLLIFGCYLLMRRLGRVPEPRRTEGGQ